ncbi:MarR family winged helix-turn-helix transcriptional regulator [Frigoriglobus tundricola]|uniref:Transcriptional regulator, MarR family n=1 Tax=Frigoriglobus tundricola TaxID=2774151 RepID=A0A6M5Z6B1_9BACT|nr:MarR family winged helix-turn-helix transcriptional regulator [Frigoriglobus tundricola]QJX00941.1 Transcriptional regulator, MarR family [Frigoriglobus tundricola]
MNSNTTPESRIAGECLAGRVRALNRVVTAIYDESLRPYQVRTTQMNVLVAIAAMGKARAADICHRLKLEKSTLSRDLDRLIERGWVLATSNGGRAQVLEATEAGRALIETLLPVWEVAQERVREVLGATLTKEIYKTTDRLRSSDRDDT